MTEPNAKAQSSTVMLTIGGMSCGGCARAVELALREAPGVRRVTVDLGKGQAVVEGQGLSAAQLVALVTEAGYSAAESQ